MPLRPAVLAAAALATLLATPGAAAPRRACELLRNDRPRPGTTDPDAALYIRSADIASDRTNLTVAIRVSDVHDATEPASGRGYAFFFSRSVEETYILYGTIWRTSPRTRFALGVVDRHTEWGDGPLNLLVQRSTYLADARVVEDEARDEVRITVPLAAFRKTRTTMKPGATVTYLAASNVRKLGATRESMPVDPGRSVAEIGLGGLGPQDAIYGNARVTYTLGRPSCVPVGR
jgi:hypothetical protein